jgi:hypothetical protein
LIFAHTTHLCDRDATVKVENRCGAKKKQGENKMAEPPKKGILTALSYLAGAVAALALFISNIGTLREAWCNSIGTFCPSEPDWAKSDTVYVFSGGTKDNRSDECKDHRVSACTRPSGPNKQLQPEMSHFDASERSGAVYLDGKPTNPNPIGTSNIGWFLQPNNASPDEVCATVFARTSACETKVFIRGQLVVREISKQ